MSVEQTAPTFAPGPTPKTVRAADGAVLATPEGWALLPQLPEGFLRRRIGRP